MFTSIRHNTRQLRLWFIAIVAIVALTSILEAGHIHGVFTETDDQCTLCQHSVALDKILAERPYVLLPPIVATAVSALLLPFIPRHHARFSLIRAPPIQLHAR